MNKTKLHCCKHSCCQVSIWKYEKNYMEIEQNVNVPESEQELYMFIIFYSTVVFYSPDPDVRRRAAAGS